MDELHALLVPAPVQQVVACQTSGSGSSTQRDVRWSNRLWPARLVDPGQALRNKWGTFLRAPTLAMALTHPLRPTSLRNHSWSFSGRGNLLYHSGQRSTRSRLWLPRADFADRKAGRHQALVPVRSAVQAPGRGQHGRQPCRLIVASRPSAHASAVRAAVALARCSAGNVAGNIVRTSITPSRSTTRLISLASAELATAMRPVSTTHLASSRRPSQGVPWAVPLGSPGLPGYTRIDGLRRAPA